METMMNSAAQMQQQQLAMKMQVGLMKTALNTQKAIGEAVISLIDTAAEIGSDSRQGKSLFSGKNFDRTV